LNLVAGIVLEDYFSVTVIMISTADLKWMIILDLQNSFFFCWGAGCCWDENFSGRSTASQVLSASISMMCFSTSFAVHNSEWCVLGNSLCQSPCFGSAEWTSGRFSEGQVLLHSSRQEAVQYSR